MLNKMAKAVILIACFFLILVLTFVAFNEPSSANIAKALASVFVSTVLIGKLRGNASTSQPKATRVIVLGIAIGLGLPVIFIMLVKALA